MSGPKSPGAVGDEELVCRGIYTNHMRNKALKKSWLKKADLAEATLSVWRLPVVGTLEQMTALLAERAQSGDELLKVVGVPAGHLRTAIVAGRKRSVCVIDDTEERPGVNHSAHASVACCQTVPRADLNAVEFMAVYDAIWALYEDGELWAKAA